MPSTVQDVSSIWACSHQTLTAFHSLCSFLTFIEEGYPANPYHCRCVALGDVRFRSDFDRVHLDLRSIVYVCGTSLTVRSIFLALVICFLCFEFRVPGICIPYHCFAAVNKQSCCPLTCV